MRDLCRVRGQDGNRGLLRLVHKPNAATGGPHKAFALSKRERERVPVERQSSRLGVTEQVRVIEAQVARQTPKTEVPVILASHSDPVVVVVETEDRCACERDCSETGVSARAADPDLTVIKADEKQLGLKGLEK